MSDFQLTPPPPADDRFSRFRAWIERAYFWRCQRPCPWDGSDSRHLKIFLEANPQLGEIEFAHWLKNYMVSEDHPAGERPRSFLSRLSNYSVEPLDRFGRSGNAHIITKQDQTQARNSAVIREARRNFDLAQDRKSVV